MATWSNKGLRKNGGKVGILYKLIFPDGKIYIGATIRKMRARVLRVVADKISQNMKSNNPMRNPIHKATMINATRTDSYRQGQREKALKQWASEGSKLRKANTKSI